MPLVGRLIPVVADTYVEKDFGTGAVKITPAHDPNDFEVGKRHDLPIINIMNDDATVNKNGGKYAGMDRYAARDAIVSDLKEQGFLVKIENIANNVSHCYRCHSVIEPLISKQWFVKMAELAKPAIEAVKIKISVLFLNVLRNLICIGWKTLRTGVFLASFGGDIAYPYSTATVAAKVRIQRRRRRMSRLRSQTQTGRRRT